MTNGILLIQLVSTWYMVGLIWMVQVVHYPMFDRVGTPEFPRYQADHSRLITPVVGFPMLIEITTAVALIVATWQSPATRNWAIVAAIMLGVVWLTTAFVSVPCHSKLSAGFDSDAHRLLVLSNWVRTTLWTGRGLILSWLVFLAMSPSPLDRNPLAG